MGQEKFKYNSFQYADDISLFLQGDSEISKVLETKSQFTKVAGPKLNKSKKKSIWLDNYKYRQNILQFDQKKIGRINKSWVSDRNIF